MVSKATEELNSMNPEVPSLEVTPAPKTSESLPELSGEMRADFKTRFKPGNPGRLKGVKNNSTRLREALLSSVGRQALRRFKNRLNGKSSAREFEKAVDQVISLLGPSKPLVSVDASTHTHFTVVLDGQQPNPAQSE
jgi:hypothetical protein